MMRTASVCTLCVLALSAAAQADVLNLSEPPDYSATVTAPTALPTFVIGTNTVSGHVDHNAGDDVDAFLISLPAGASLSSVTVTISNFTVQGSFGNWGVYYAQGPGPTIGGAANGTGNLNALPFSNIYGGSLLSAVFGSSAGGADTTGNPFSGFSSYDYMWTFTVVPAPSAAALLGLGGLAAARRRR